MQHWSDMSAHWHEDYERGRPSYPRAAVRVPALAASATVLELGAGTGKLTRVLVDEFASVLAVEPDPDMRRWLADLCPTATLVAGTAEAVPLADASVDAVFAAEAFHWFAHERALAEIARVLQPRGVLVLMWNRPAGATEPPIAAVEQLLEPHWPQEVELPLDLNPNRFSYARDWPQAFTQSAFEPLQESRFPNPHAVGPEELVAFFGSMGWIGALPDDQRLALLGDIRSRLTAREYQLPFETHVYSTRLADPARPPTA